LLLTHVFDLQKSFVPTYTNDREKPSDSGLVVILQRMIAALEDAGNYLPALLLSVSNEDAAWKPPSQNWSILEIVCHLIDEEREDFRYRIQSTLEDSNREWPSINPDLWSIDRRYGDRDFQKMVEEFRQERNKSVLWLKSLKEPNWYESYEHPHLGKIRAGDLLVSWVAHDQLHVRQIAKRRYEMINRDSGNFQFDYAGDWDS
jgi:hypothetical protein